VTFSGTSGLLTLTPPKVQQLYEWLCEVMGGGCSRGAHTQQQHTKARTKHQSQRIPPPSRHHYSLGQINNAAATLTVGRHCSTESPE
jgi:hypothetical protein